MLLDVGGTPLVSREDLGWWGKLILCFGRLSDRSGGMHYRGVPFYNLDAR